jgi:hypothetical protein
MNHFAFLGISGVALYFADYGAAVTYYQQVLGPPDYTEGEGTREWQLGSTALTLLKGRAGNPRNVEVILTMQSPEAAEALQATFIAAGGVGEAPSNQVMGRLMRYCPVRDPFGTELLIVCPLP